jgi:hypothetical protein
MIIFATIDMLLVKLWISVVTLAFQFDHWFIALIAKGFSNSCLLSSFLLSLRILNLLIIKFKGHQDLLVLCLILSKLQFHMLSFLLLYFLGSLIS